MLSCYSFEHDDVSSNSYGGSHMNFVVLSEMNAIVWNFFQYKLLYQETWHNH